LKGQPNRLRPDTLNAQSVLPWTVCGAIQPNCLVLGLLLVGRKLDVLDEHEFAFVIFDDVVAVNAVAVRIEVVGPLQS